MHKKPKGKNQNFFGNGTYKKLKLDFFLNDTHNKPIVGTLEKSSSSHRGVIHLEEQQIIRAIDGEKLKWRTCKHHCMH